MAGLGNCPHSFSMNCRPCREGKEMTPITGWSGSAEHFIRNNPSIPLNLLISKDFSEIYFFLRTPLIFKKPSLLLWPAYR
jgi:hypothetical protein